MHATLGFNLSHLGTVIEPELRVFFAETNRSFAFRKRLESYGCKHGFVKGSALCEITDTERDMINHGVLLLITVSEDSPRDSLLYSSCATPTE